MSIDERRLMIVEGTGRRIHGRFPREALINSNPANICKMMRWQNNTGGDRRPLKVKREHCFLDLFQSNQGSCLFVCPSHTQRDYFATSSFC